MQISVIEVNQNIVFVSQVVYQTINCDYFHNHQLHTKDKCGSQYVTASVKLGAFSQKLLTDSIFVCVNAHAGLVIATPAGTRGASQL